MSVKSFKFVSPGVFINEIDNSFIPKSADAIGPVVIGRARSGLAMTPIKVQSYDEFVQMFGETVPGGGGGDVYRDGNLQSPMYGTYAAKAFLRANVAPLTYIRLLGQQRSDNDGSNAAKAGWEVEDTPRGRTEGPEVNGGTYGLFVWPSSSTVLTTAKLCAIGTGSLAAVFYVNSSASVLLSGTMIGGTTAAQTGSGDPAGKQACVTASTNAMIGSDSSSQFTLVITGANAANGALVSEKIIIGFDDTTDNYIRKKLNTNPQLTIDYGASPFYANSAVKNYWLGETYDQWLRVNDLINPTTKLMGAILPIQSGSANSPGKMKGVSSTEAKAGWFIGQDLGDPANYQPFDAQKLFRLKGRGHGEWLQRNCKVTISNVRQSTTTVSDYGSFSVVIRKIGDTDANRVVLERFDLCNLDPTSPNYVARKIGNKFSEWNETDSRLITYGEYDNQSKYVYVEMDDLVDEGGADATLLPFGYYGPPRFGTLSAIGNDVSGNVFTFSGVTPTAYNMGSNFNAYLSGAVTGPEQSHAAAPYFLINASSSTNGGAAVEWQQSAFTMGQLTASMQFPYALLRLSASDNGITDQTKACFGMTTQRSRTSTRAQSGMGFLNRMLYASVADDPIDTARVNGVDGYAYIFSLDDIVLNTTTNEPSIFYYASGSRTREASYTSSSYTALLNSGIRQFTAPFWGGFDGWDIKKPDPAYNNGMSSTSTPQNDYIYHTWMRAIDTVADPEQIDMNLLAAPGLTLDKLTAEMVDLCESRGDSMALIDLANVYVPPAEAYYSSKTSRIATTPTNAANNLRNRYLDSSYGATFYPWVQTRDESSGRLLWIPPSVAMMGVLASSEAATQLWFAPAGFNRGGLTDGAAGIPVTGITERLTSKDRDTLYEARINPIASFPSSGLVVFGQKTLQERQSALDRINVRRLVIYLKKQISILSTEVLFEQNVQATWNRFKALVEPFLANVKTEYGITDYTLILDDSTTTPDLIDQNILYAKIMVKPARAIEYIAIDFVITSTGASFDD